MHLLSYVFCTLHFPRLFTRPLQVMLVVSIDLPNCDPSALTTSDLATLRADVACAAEHVATASVLVREQDCLKPRILSKPVLQITSVAGRDTSLGGNGCNWTIPLSSSDVSNTASPGGGYACPTARRRRRRAQAAEAARGLVHSREHDRHIAAGRELTYTTEANSLLAPDNSTGVDFRMVVSVTQASIASQFSLTEGSACSTWLVSHVQLLTPTANPAYSALYQLGFSIADALSLLVSSEVMPARLCAIGSP
jgi:hypothetical protein